MCLYRSSLRLLTEIGANTAPAVHVLEYENREFIQEDRIQENGRYAGKPSPELDKAWHDLLNCKFGNSKRGNKSKRMA